MPAAARVTDPHTCPCPTPLPHQGGPVLPPCSLTVNINKLAAARASDRALCKIPAPNFIVTGAGTVSIDGLPAARKGDRMMHPPPGQIDDGSPDVIIGGPTVGVTLGDPLAGTTVCGAASAGRNPAPGAVFPPGHPSAGQQIPANTAAQSYNNCGVESARQIINQTTPLAPVGQEALLNQAIANGNADNVPGNLYASGGTVPSQKVNILANNGIGAHEADPTMETLLQNVAEGNGVIIDVWAARIWPAAVVTNSGMVPGSNSGGHSILVTGVSFDANGDLDQVTVNDTGLGTCGQEIAGATVGAALIGGGNSHVVTSQPIW